MAKVPPMRFHQRRLPSVVFASVFALHLVVGEFFGDVWFDRIRVLGPWWWLYRGVLGLGLLFFAYRTWRPPVRMSFDDDGLVVWVRGFGRIAWTDVQRVHEARGYLQLDRTEAARARDGSRRTADSRGARRFPRGNRGRSRRRPCPAPPRTSSR